MLRRERERELMNLMIVADAFASPDPPPDQVFVWKVLNESLFCLLFKQIAECFKLSEPQSEALLLVLLI